MPDSIPGAIPRTENTVPFASQRKQKFIFRLQDCAWNREFQWCATSSISHGSIIPFRRSRGSMAAGF